MSAVAKLSPVAKRLETITSKAGVNDREMAQIFSTSPQTIYRWRHSQAEPQPQHLRRILDLAFLAEELSELYIPKEAHVWLFSRHRLLGGKAPVEVITTGDIDPILALIAQLKDGAYI